ncbi:MAG: glycerol-3-phosphate dehydrogenase, partial [Candidatus Rokuibacteriota bacterium]
MITVVGAGSWGTALAVHLARGGAEVRLCARSAEVVEAIRARRRNPWYLSDVD